MDNFILNFLWFNKNIAVSLNQKVGNKIIPLTEYFFWPQQDAWEEIQLFLNKENWVNADDSFSILNQITEVINYWEHEEKTSTILSEIRSKFPSCVFLDAN